MTTQAPAGLPAGGSFQRRPTRPAWLGWLGWGLLACEAAYLVALHQGIAPPPGGFATQWWHPTRSWLDVLWISELEGFPVRATVLAALPATVLAVGVLASSPPAVARWLALTGVATSLLFGFYGFGPVRVWEFFHWRGSLVMLTIGASLGGALAAPWLARSWLSLRPLTRAITYLPVLAAVVVLLRHTTGTDERLAFNFSPWPAVTIFGLEIGAYAVVGVLFGMAIGVAAATEWRARAPLALAGLALGAVTPVLWMALRFGSLPDVAAVALAAVTALAIAGASLARGPDREDTLLRRAGVIALGGTLAFLPLFAGRALSTGDYTVTRFVRAQKVIDALAVYYAKRDGYPEELGELVEMGYLDAIPRPRVGFDVLYDWTGLDPLRFSYQSLGSSYVLEFEFTEWVQCAYNPPWEDEEEFEDDPEWAEEDGLGEAWSCPESRPELW